MFKKQNLVAVLVTLFLGLTTIMPAYAAESNTSKPNFFSQMITFISQKFGLDKTQVQNAVTQFKQQKKQDRRESRLDRLVKDKKISQDQENAILKELADLRTKYSSKQTQAEQNELKAWAQANGIDFSIIMPPARPSSAPRPNGIIRPSGERSDDDK